MRKVVIKMYENIHRHVYSITDSIMHFLQAEDIVSRLQEYIAKHPDLIVIDPLDNIRNLRNRYESYEFIQEGIQFKG